MIKFYLLVFLATAVLSFTLTLFFRFVAFKIGAVDYPDERKIHKKPVARLGGLAIFIAFFIVVFSISSLDKHLVGLFIGTLILLFFGLLDDIFNLNPFVKLFGQILAALAIIASGIGIDYITNPFGGIIYLNTLKIPIDLFGVTYHITVWSDLFTIFWTVVLINAVNFLDGLDGLAAGVSGISALVIFLLSLSSGVFQPQTAILALVLAGTAFGFLPLNFYPAKIFMGDTGSMFLGFMLAVLAIFSGGKVATALLILGLPILDVLWAFIRRVLAGKSPFRPDKKHLHHAFLKKGLSQRQTVLIIYVITLVFGTLALISKTFYKFVALVTLALLVVVLISFLYFLDTKKENPNI